MKTLNLTVKRKWFDLIASGQKKFEYREDKPYWKSRLFKGDIPKNFDIVRFKNGYKPNSPTVDVEWRGTMFTSPEWHTPKHGEVLKGDIIVIKLGRVLNIRGGEWKQIGQKH